LHRYPQRAAHNNFRRNTFLIVRVIFIKLKTVKTANRYNSTYMFTYIQSNFPSRISRPKRYYTSNCI